MNWRTVNVGDQLLYQVDDFDGSAQIKCTVTEVHDDHMIAHGDDMNLWVDDWNADQFFPEAAKYNINGHYFTYDPAEHDVHFYCDRRSNTKWVCMNDCERDCPRYYCCQYIADADDALKIIENE